MANQQVLALDVTHVITMQPIRLPKFTQLCFRIRHYKDVVFIRSDYSIFIFIIRIKRGYKS